MSADYRMTQISTKYQPLVSVIIPLYNQEEYIHEAVESVKAQTYSNWEIIVCDDCSTDNSYEIAQKSIAPLPQGKAFLIQNQINSGVSKTRNRAVGQSRGKYLAFLDADDIWFPEKLSKQISCFNSNPDLGVVFTGVKVVCESQNDPNSLYLCKHFEKIFCEVPEQRQDFFKLFLSGNYICLSSIMIRRELFDKVGGFDRNLKFQYEDWILLLKSLPICDFKGITSPLTGYRYYPESYSARYFLNPDAAVPVQEVHQRIFTFLTEKIFTYPNYDRKEILLSLLILSKLYLKQFLKKIPFLKNLYRKIKEEYRYWQQKKRMNLLILFVTSRCNLKCSHCFYLNELNGTLEMSSVEIKRFISTFKKVNMVLVTGGEPFLRPDIEDILKQILQNSDVAINTNGTLKKKTIEVLDRILTESKGNKMIIVSVSIDGFKTTHDSIRNAHCYEKSFNTLKALIKLKHKHPNLFVYVNTTICEQNIEELAEFANYIRDNMSVDYHNFEIIRENPKDGDELRITPSKLKSLYREIIELQKKAYQDYPSSARFKAQYMNYFFNDPWDSTCVAGKNCAVIYEDGNFAACELRPVLFNLKEKGWDFVKAWKSNELQKEIKKIQTDKCFCTHGCWISCSIRQNNTDFFNADEQKPFAAS